LFRWKLHQVDRDVQFGAKAVPTCCVPSGTTARRAPAGLFCGNWNAASIEALAVLTRRQIAIGLNPDRLTDAAGRGLL
jgi:hypothetical protein